MNKLYTAALLIISAITSFTALAQPTNRTYGIATGNTNFGGFNSNAWIDPAVGGGDYFSGGVYVYQGSYMDSFMIVKTDAAYNPMMTWAHWAQQWSHRIISTADNGILLVLHGDMGSGWGVNLVKFDPNLNVIWQTRIPIVYGPTIWSRIDVESVVDQNTGQESYYVLYGENLMTGWPEDHVINLARFDQNGAFMWNTQYRRQGGPDMYDSPSGLTSYPDPNTGNPLIVMVGSNGSYMGQYTLWAMTADDMGNVVTPYTEISTIPAELEWPDVVYDGQDLAITYLQENNGYSVPGATTNASFIGIIKTDVNFTPIYSMLHWIRCENYGLGISVAADGNYIVSGWNSWCTTNPFNSSPVLMKINNPTGGVMWCNTYNILHNTQAAYHGRHVQDANNFIHMAYTASIPGLNGTSTRLLVTNPLGGSCGVNRERPSTYDYLPTTNQVTYDANPWFPPAGLGLAPFALPLAMTVCDPAVKPELYRLAEATPTNTAITLAPTLLRSNDKLTCTITTESEATAEVTITNILGQLQHSSRQQLTPGSNTIAISATLPTGMYLVQVAIDGKLQKTQKISVVE